MYNYQRDEMRDSLWSTVVNVMRIYTQYNSLQCKRSGMPEILKENKEIH